MERFAKPSDEYMAEVDDIISQLVVDGAIAEENEMDATAEYHSRLVWYLRDYFDTLNIIREEKENEN